MIKIINPRTHKGLITLFLLVLLISLEATAQNEVAIGSPNTKSNAILYLNGNGSQGLILPVVTNKTSVSGPDKGMIVFDDSDKKVWYRNDNAWVEVGGSSTGAGDNGTLTLQLFEGNTLQLRDGATTLSSVKIAGGTAAPGAFMVWNGTTWQYATLNGDVTGANGALQVGGIKGKTVPALPTTTTTQALVWDGTAWKFQALTAGTDSQDLSLNTTTNSLSLTNDATPVSLTPYMQTLSLNGNILGISGGTSTVTLPSSGSGTVTSISAGTGLTTSSSPITDTGTIGIAPGGVDSNELKDGSVTSGKIASNAVSNGNIASNANIDISKLNGGGTSNNNKVLKVVGGVVTYADDLTGSGDMTKSIYDPDNSGVVDLATTVTTNANLTGPVTSTGNATSIANGAITNAMLATINTAGKVDGGAITSGNIVTSGTITATSFTGNGAGLTNVPLTGTAGGDLTGTYPNPVIGAGKITNTQINTNAAIDDTKLATISTPGKVSGAAITSGNIVTSGTITATSFTGDGAGLTNVPLTGTAGGDLTGTYPNPTVGVGKITNAQISTTADIADTKLATITTLGKVSGNAINTGTIGGNTVINTTGAVTAASFTGNGAGLTNVPVTGNAGGDLTGTYPNPTIGTAAGANVVTAINNATTSKINFANLTIPTSTSTTTGLLTGADWTTFNSKGSGTLTAVSVTTANGFSGTSSGGATPALTLTTSVGGILKGQGGAIVAANSGTDYLAPNAPISVGTSTKITYDANGLVTSGTTLSASDLPAMTSTLGGAVPTPPNDATKFLAGDGTWATPAGGGTGTVTSVSVTTANGISGVVTDPTGAPAISLSLGAITPTTVNGVALSGSSTLAVTGPASVSGTNTGDQTITLTGNVTGTGTGSFPTTIANGVVTNAMLNAVPTATFKGRATAASGAPEDLTVAQAKTLLNLTGTNTGDQTITLTGDVTGTGTGSFATTLATVPVAKGGTGLTAAPANGQLMIGNGTGYALSTLTAGTGVNITNAAGTITINTSGLSPALNSGQIYVGSVGNLATGVDMSGDATISNSGVVTLSNLPATRTNLGLGALATLSTVNLAGADVTGILPVANGGTGRATWDGLLFGSGSTLSDISTGTAGQILKVAGTTPSWQDFIVTSTEITDGSITSDDILDGTITTAKIAPNGTTRSILANGTAGNVQWVAPSGNNQVLGSNGTGDLVFRDATTAVANSGTGIRTVAGGAADGVIATELSVREALDAVKGWGLTGNDISATPTSFIGTTGSNDLIFKTNSAETMRITPTGNVGIGTNAPLSDLQISNTTHLFDFTTGSALSYNLYENAGNLLHTTAGSASALALEPAKAGLYVNSAASANASFGTSLANRMVLTETGLSVNKDAADPSAVLHVVSETLAGGGTPRGFMMPSLITSDRDAIPSPLTGLMIFNETTNSPNYYNGTSWQSLSSGWGLTGNTLAGTERIGSDNAQPLVFETSNTERMRIDATGNVGIGTTSPLNLFHINNDAATGNFMRITNSGAPSGMLIGNSGSGGKEAFVSNAENAAMYFQTNSANRMAIDATGNVGIGTITPTAKLEVAGQIKMTGGGTLVDGYVLTSDATGLATWKAIPAGGGTGWGISGNAGLSDANFIGPSTVVPFNIKIGGSRSGRIDPTLANSFFGYEAGDVTTGANNSVFGYRALLVNTTGIDNTAIGYNALRNNSTAGGNTAVGRGALFSQSTDIGVANTWNTAVGFQALYFNQPTNTTTGKWNTAMGYRAGEANTSGSYNTFIGSLAGQASSTGINFSTAIGYNAQVTASNAIVLGGTGGDAVNVGIGVTAPINKLDVEGGAAIGATYSGASVAPTNGLIVQGNVGIGIAAPNAPLQLGTATANRKLVLYDVNNNDHQFYGFGVQSGEIRYQTQSTLSNHRFYAGTSATTSGLLMTISGGGNVAITGSLSKGSGTFKIDHPLDPENKYLYHSFVESPDMMNVYNGNIITNDQGEVAVALPEYFEALNRDFRYQLTVIGTFAQAIVYKKIENNKFVIKTDKPNVEVSWQVTGIRKDPFAEKNPVIPEVEKDPSDKGRYLHPEAYGKPPEMKIGNVKNDLN